MPQGLWFLGSFILLVVWGPLKSIKMPQGLWFLGSFILLVAWRPLYSIKMPQGLWFLGSFSVLSYFTPFQPILYFTLLPNFALYISFYILFFPRFEFLIFLKYQTEEELILWTSHGGLILILNFDSIFGKFHRLVWFIYRATSQHC